MHRALPILSWLFVICMLSSTLPFGIQNAWAAGPGRRGITALNKTNRVQSTTIFAPNNVEAYLQNNGLLFNSFNNQTGGVVFLSTDQGTSCVEVDAGLKNHTVYALAVKGANLFAGTDTGIFLSTNNGTSWTAVNTGLTNDSIRSLAVSGANIFAGTLAAGVFLSTNNGTSWSAVNTGLTNDSVRSFAVSGTMIFAGTYGGLVFLSNNSGASWTPVNSGLPGSTCINALAVLGTNLYAGTLGNGVYRSTDNGTSWTLLNSGLSSHANISAIAVSGANLFTGAGGGGVFLSADSGRSWKAVNSGLSLQVLSLAVSGANLFAGTEGSINLSTDNGTSWSQVNSNLKETYIINQIAVSGTNLFFAGGFLGRNTGLFWPNGSRNSAVFSAGLWIIGRSSLDGKLHASVSNYNTEYQAGPIMGTYSGDTSTISTITGNSSDPKWNIMTLSRFTPPSDPTYQLWTSGTVPGAPLTANGKPYIIGDEAAYWVMNDLDLSGHARTSKTSPMGLEVQNYFFGSNQNEALSNTIFMGMRIINKSTITYNNTFIGLWSDIDLGDFIDDYTGCDTVRSLGYTYNGGIVDAVYGPACPAAGYDFIEGPKVPGLPTDSALYDGKWVRGFKNLPMTAFTKYINGGSFYHDPPLGDTAYARQAYNFLNGYIGSNGNPFIGPDGLPSKFVDSGDPVTGTGWLAQWEWPPSDVRQLLATGPFALQPGDTQQVFVAFIIGQGADRLNSISVLKRYDDSVQLLFNTNISALTGVVENKWVNVPNSYALTQNYPNPFNPATVIRYQLPVNSFVTLKVFDVLGREAAVLVNERKDAGEHSVRFDGSKFASGIYLYRLQTGDFIQTRKLLLLK